MAANILANSKKHILHARRCLGGLGAHQAQYDSSRLLIGFYCFAIFDLLCTDLPSDQSLKDPLAGWKEWIWNQHVRTVNGSGFRPSPYMNSSGPTPDSGLDEHPPSESPHLIMTYSALLSLAVFRDDFSTLDIDGLKKFISLTQREDGSFGAVAGEYQGETDIRMSYCAFSICAMLNDWTCIDVPKAIQFIKSCRSYEGGYGQAPHNEAHGGSTFCAIATLYLSPFPSQSQLKPPELDQTIRWLVRNQTGEGGFRGRTEKETDACYSFWNCASLKVLQSDHLIDAQANAQYIEECQFRFGGIAKVPEEMPDPYHTYLGLASVCLCPPGGEFGLPEMDPLLNARVETAKWIRDHLTSRR